MFLITFVSKTEKFDTKVAINAYLQISVAREPFCCSGSEVVARRVHFIKSKKEILIKPV